MTETRTADVQQEPGEQQDQRPPERVLSATRVAVHDGKRHVLAPTTLEVRTGSLLVAAGDPGHGHTLLALALGGRLSGAEGSVALDGLAAPRVRQESVALVDVPGVTEPDGAVPLATIAGEELAMAGRNARRKAVHEWLVANRLGEHVDDRIDELPPAVRVSALCRLAALRPNVDFLVLVLPERSGDVPDSWVATARELVAADYGVLVTASLGAAAALSTYDDLTIVQLGNDPGPEPGTDPGDDPDSSEEDPA